VNVVTPLHTGVSIGVSGLASRGWPPSVTARTEPATAMAASIRDQSDPGIHGTLADQARVRDVPGVTPCGGP